MPLLFGRALEVLWNFFLWKRPDAGRIEGKEEKGMTEQMRWLDGVTNFMVMGLSKFWDLVMNREACHAADHGVTKNYTQLSD